MKHVGSGAPLRHSVLVTGFGAFPGTRKNPTIAILERLERSRTRLSRLGIGLACVRLPVTYACIGRAVRQAVETHRPDAILHLGLASRRKMLCVETRALNRAGPLHHDAARRTPESQVLTPGAADSLKSTYPSQRILAAIRATGLPARHSIDAGDYVCNATLYRTLLEGLAPQVGFLHVPRTRRESQPGRERRPNVEELTRAAWSAILVMAVTAQKEGQNRKRRSSIG